MLVESSLAVALKAFLTKIAVGLIKANLVQYAIRAFDVYSTFYAVHDALGYILSKNEIQPGYGLAMVSDYIGGSAAEKVLKIGHVDFHVEKRPSGIYIASRVISPFQVTNIDRGPLLGKCDMCGGTGQVPLNHLPTTVNHWVYRPCPKCDSNKKLSQQPIYRPANLNSPISVGAEEIRKRPIKQDTQRLTREELKRLKALRNGEL